MTIDVILNNWVVLLVYSTAGIIVLRLAGRQFAFIAPWLVFLTHLLGIGLGVGAAVNEIGISLTLAYVIPHGIFELTGLALACFVGSRVVEHRQVWRPLLPIAAALIVVAAFIEVHITPYPIIAWVR